MNIKEVRGDQWSWKEPHRFLVGTLILCVAVAIPGSAHRFMFRLALAGAAFASKKAAGLVNNARQSLQRLQCCIHCVGHVGTKAKKRDLSKPL